MKTPKQTPPSLVGRFPNHQAMWISRDLVDFRSLFETTSEYPHDEGMVAGMSQDNAGEGTGRSLGVMASGYDNVPAADGETYPPG